MASRSVYVMEPIVRFRDVFCRTFRNGLVPWTFNRSKRPLPEESVVRTGKCLAGIPDQETLPRFALVRRNWRLYKAVVAYTQIFSS